VVSCAATAEQMNQDTTLGGYYQLAINQFVDDFRLAPAGDRPGLVAAPPHVRDGRLAALLAGTVHALCDETRTPYPAWLSEIGTKSPTPFFILKPEGGCSANFAMAQMLRSPPWFFCRNVFVPAQYLHRA
jgi:hypothetical protein